MTKCHACGLEEPSQLRCGVCGKTYCSEHLLRQNHNCFVDPKSIRDDQYAGKTYGSGAARETNPPRADYYDADQFEHRHQYSAKRAQPTWKTISGSSTYVIIIICAVLQMIGIAGALGYTPLYNFWESLVLRTSFEFVLYRPWTVITHMFLHSRGTFYHILFNMFTLFFFGSYLEKLIGKKAFVATFLVSGFVAAIGFIIVNSYIFGNPEIGVVGASGAIFGILAAVTVLNPNLSVFIFPIPIPVKIKYMLLFFALIDFLLMMASMGVGEINIFTGIAHAAHLSGLFVGLWIGYYFRKKLIKKMRQPGF